MSRAYTILGAGGFIGSHLKARLEASGRRVHAPARGVDLAEMEHDVVVYCIGVTADFRTRKLDAVEAHVGALLPLLRRARFRTLLYLSSTRLYKRGASPAVEADPVAVSPSDQDDLYAISKLMGESLVLSAAAEARVLRLSNVYGPDFRSRNFLSTILTRALDAGEIVLESSLDSEKDYVALDDVLDLIVKVAEEGKEPIYNIASGSNVSHGAVVAELSRLTGCKVSVAEGARAQRFPAISNHRIQTAFGFKPKSLIQDLGTLVDSFRNRNQP